MPELQTRIKDLARFGEPSRWFTVKMYPPPDDKLGTTHREYRYTFKGPPRQMDDPLIRMIIRTIRKLSKDHMLVAAAEIWPHNLDETPPIWPGRAGGATKLYAFTQLFEEFPLAAEICVARGTNTLTAEDILVRKKWKRRGAGAEPWTPLKTWLLQFPLPVQLTSGDDSRGIPRIILSQQRWWGKTGKHFRLMSLPLEIRLVIFQHILGENMCPSVRIDPMTRQEKVTLRHPGVALAQIEEPGSAVGSDLPNCAVLLLNKSLHQEALRAGFQGSRKHFYRPDVLQGVIRASATSSYNQLSRIYLHLDITRYFEFFGVRFNFSAVPSVQYSPIGCTASLLQGISGLKHFELFFTSPYGPNRRSTPWYNSGHSNTVEVYPCQKTTVDWILTFGFPYLKDIPNVHLIGSIKSCTKFRWYYILGKEYEQRKLDYRTHGYDQAAEIAVLLEGTMDHAPPYYCPASCVNQPQDLHHFDHDDVYGKPIYTPTLAVGGTSSLRTSAPEDTPASVVKEGFLWSKVLVHAGVLYSSQSRGHEYFNELYAMSLSQAIYDIAGIYWKAEKQAEEGATFFIVASLPRLADGIGTAVVNL